MGWAGPYSNGWATNLGSIPFSQGNRGISGIRGANDDESIQVNDDHGPLLVFRTAPGRLARLLYLGGGKGSELLNRK